VPDPRVRFHETERCDDDVWGAHATQLPETERLTALGQIDHDNRPGLPHVNVRGTMLTWRQEDADRKAGAVEDRGRQ